jgi:hypothetical protein
VESSPAESVGFGTTPIIAPTLPPDIGNSMRYPEKNSSH